MELTKWNAAKQAIVEAKSVDEVKIIKDKAEAMRAYAKQVGESLEVQNNICEIKLRAERKMGTMLKEMPKAKGGQPFQNKPTGNIMSPVEKQPTLKDIGIEKHESSRYQKIAELPEKTFEKIVAETKAEEKELTEALMLSTAKKIDRAKKIEEQRKGIADGTLELPKGKYEIIVIDPPWKYQDEKVYSADGFRGLTDYPTMTIKEIKNHFIKNNFAADDCVLWLWTTHKFMRHSFELLDSWGFEEKAILTWCKQKMGIGRWLRSKSEFCIMAVKGKPLINLTNQTTVLNADAKVHSKKPDEFYKMVDELCIGRKLDYFARTKREGWDVYGDEIK